MFRFIVRASFVKVKKGFLVLLFLRMPDVGYEHLDQSQEVMNFLDIADSSKEPQRSPRQNGLLGAFGRWRQTLLRRKRVRYFSQIRSRDLQAFQTYASESIN
jgi:hypothetical protein